MNSFRAEGKPPHWEMEPLEAMIHIPKADAPKLKNPEKWSSDFVDFLEKCLQKNPDVRASAKEILFVILCFSFS